MPDRVEVVEYLSSRCLITKTYTDKMEGELQIWPRHLECNESVKLKIQISSLSTNSFSLSKLENGEAILATGNQKEILNSWILPVISKIKDTLRKHTVNQQGRYVPSRKDWIRAPYTLEEWESVKEILL